MKLFIVPGFTESITDAQYNVLKNTVSQTCYTPVLVPIHWKNRVMTQYVSELINFLLAHKGKNEEFALLGFSFGAYAALIASVQLQPNHLYLCSLSPYFREDLPRTPEKWLKNLGKKRTKDFYNFSFNTIAQQSSCPVTLLAGSLEMENYPTLKQRVLQAQSAMPNAKYLCIQGAHHNIGQPEYIAAIHTELLQYNKKD